MLMMTWPFLSIKAYSSSSSLSYCLRCVFSNVGLFVLKSFSRFFSTSVCRLASLMSKSSCASASEHVLVR
jgi:hypothetical protein